MKKLLLSLALVLGLAAFTAAQTIFSQNFETTMTSLPAGWSTGNASYHPGNPGWTFNNSWSGSNWNSYVPTHTYCAYVDDIDNNTGVVDDYDTLYTSSFNCSAYSHIFLSLDLNFNNYTTGEVGTIAISTNGGTTWTTAATLPVYYGDVSWHNGQVFNLSSYAAGQSNVMLAFTWNNAGAVSQGYAGWGMAIDNISVYVPLNYDVSVTSQNLNYLVKVGSPYTISGILHNFGGDSITSMHLNYSVNGGPAVTDAISSILINSTSDYSFTHSTPWTPSATGTYTMKIWADNLNGANADQNHVNDTLVANFLAIDSVQQKVVLLEEFNQASCDPCAQATPNVDSVLWNSQRICNGVRYHVSWPGTDYMNDETQSPFVNARVGYYSVSGVPDAKLDGSTDIYPGAGGLSSAAIQSEAAQGSPFKITIDSANFDPVTNKFTATATIKSFASFSSGITAQAVLTVDTITYAANQSTETIPQYVFPQVAQDMMPSSIGTSLGAFTPGSSQTLTLSWTKNHPWGYKPSVYTYDSTGNHITVFVQTNSGIPSLSIPSQYVFQSASKGVKGTPYYPSGVQKIASGVYFNLYPNPVNGGNATVAFKLDKSQSTSIVLYNMMGQKVYSVDNGMTSAGMHEVTLNCGGLQSGVYFVRFTTDNVTTVKKLVIQQ